MAATKLLICLKVTVFKGISFLIGVATQLTQGPWPSIYQCSFPTLSVHLHKESSSFRNEKSNHASMKLEKPEEKPDSPVSPPPTLNKGMPYPTNSLSRGPNHHRKSNYVAN
jgi:hypothetical protein